VPEAPPNNVPPPPAGQSNDDFSAEIRALAIELVLAQSLSTANGQLAKLGVRVFPERSDDIMTYYRNMARLVHPDKNGNSQQATAAFKILSDLKSSFRHISQVSLKSFQEAPG
jgi:hypothetical protein